MVVSSGTGLMGISCCALPAGRTSVRAVVGSAPPRVCVPHRAWRHGRLACAADLGAGALQEMGGSWGWPVGLWWGPVCEGGGSTPRGAGAAFQSGSVISHCQKVHAAFTFSHALKQLCYEKFQTYAEVETTAQRSQDTYPPRSMLPRCCCGGLIWLLFLFLLLCCSISKQVSDITAFPLSALQYVVQKKTKTPALLRW